MFNIFASFSTLTGQPFWVFSDKAPSSKILRLIEDACDKVTCQMNSDNPWLMTITKDPRPTVGQIAKDVFFCEPDQFEGDQWLIANLQFWESCMNKLSLLDGLSEMNKLIGVADEGKEMLRRWQSEYGLLCFNINWG